MLKIKRPAEEFEKELKKLNYKDSKFDMFMILTSLAYLSSDPKEYETYLQIFTKSDYLAEWQKNWRNKVGKWYGEEFTVPIETLFKIINNNKIEQLPNHIYTQK